MKRRGLKRPASALLSEASTGREREGLARPAYGKAGSMVSMDVKAKAKPKGKNTRKKEVKDSKGTMKGNACAKRATPKGAIAGESLRAARRRAILQLVPKKMQQQFKNGCSKCRFTRCTVSCWMSRGFELPEM